MVDENYDENYDGSDAPDFIEAAIYDGRDFESAIDDLLSYAVPRCYYIDGIKQQLLKKYWVELAKGTRHREILLLIDATWPQVSTLLNSHYLLRDFDKIVRAQGAEAKLLTAEDEAERRAIDGVPRNGKLYSDGLLTTLLKAGNPDKYADRQKHEHQGVVMHMDIQGVVRDPKPITIDQDLVDG